ncbi:MAG: hypothetical protein OHK0053_18120 [Microscillaceae bacterium]
MRVCTVLFFFLVFADGQWAQAQKLNVAEERIFRAEAARLVEAYYQNLPQVIAKRKDSVMVQEDNDEGVAQNRNISFKQQFINQFFDNNDIYVYNDLSPDENPDPAAKRVMTIDEYLDQLLYYYGEQGPGTFQSRMNSANVVQVGYNSQAAEKFYYAKIKIERDFKGKYLGKYHTDNRRTLDFYVKTLDRPDVRLKKFTIIGIDFESTQLALDKLSPEQAMAKGLQFFDQEDYATAFKYLIRHKDNKALQKNSNATWALGYMYFWGRGTERSDAEMVKWLEYSADRNNVYALHYLGENYYFGEYGVEEDEKKAFKYIKEAARKGFAESQFFLGERYQKGEGVRQSNRTAKNWYEKAAKQGHAKATYALKQMGSN